MLFIRIVRGNGVRLNPKYVLITEKVHEVPENRYVAGLSFFWKEKIETAFNVKTNDLIYMIYMKAFSMRLEKCAGKIGGIWKHLRQKGLLHESNIALTQNDVRYCDKSDGVWFF